MLILQYYITILTMFAIHMVKCEELNETSSTTITPNISSSTEFDIQTSTIENLLTTANDSLTSSSSSSTIATTSAENLNDLKVDETTLSWELIYPEQNSSSLPPTATSNTPVSSKTFTTASAFVSNLPKYFKVDDVTNCQKYFGQCIRQVLTNVVPKLKDGNRALNIPSLDPMYFNQIAFQYNSGPLTGYITIRYALIYGLTMMKFKSVDFYKLENNKFKIRLAIVVNKMEAIGAYKGDMHLNNVRVRPRGDFNVTMTGLTLDVISTGLVYTKDEHKFLKLIKNNITTSLKDSKINATGIFPDQRLNEIVVNVANQYWRDLFNIVLPETRSYWSPILLDALNGALSMVPFDFLI